MKNNNSQGCKHTNSGATNENTGDTCDDSDLLMPPSLYKMFKQGIDLNIKIVSWTMLFALLAFHIGMENKLSHYYIYGIYVIIMIYYLIEKIQLIRSYLK